MNISVRAGAAPLAVQSEAPAATRKTRKPVTAAEAMRKQEEWENDPVRRQKYRLRMNATKRAFNFVGGSAVSGDIVDPDFDEGL